MLKSFDGRDADFRSHGNLRDSSSFFYQIALSCAAIPSADNNADRINIDSAQRRHRPPQNRKRGAVTRLRTIRIRRSGRRGLRWDGEESTFRGF